MAKTEKKQVSRIKSKKKLWYTITAPKIFGQREVGEAYLTSPESALGRSMKANLKDITGNIKDQNANVFFRIGTADGSVLRTYTTGYELSASYVKRAVRKNTARIDDYVLGTTKDGKKAVVKTFIVTRYRSQRSVRTALREKLRELMQEELSRNSFESLVNAIVTRKVQGTFKKGLHKIFPVKEVSVRVVKLQGESPSSTDEEVMEEEPEMAEEEASVEESSEEDQDAEDEDSDEEPQED
ncbi:hypothetical protein COV20_04200 [Candidatus Woesearchaeota archaeon CG10_big_fil_rev_8_21_14_0_10_45_16]|nr:MAG: hypothetical protein COV20_04200 [Candidatus Woesearchaeota archaeon CG10_big_fil_rev_8_21_14_0_10_45_16]